MRALTRRPLLLSLLVLGAVETARFVARPPHPGPRRAPAHRRGDAGGGARARQRRWKARAPGGPRPSRSRGSCAACPARCPRTPSSTPSSRSWGSAPAPTTWPWSAAAPTRTTSRRSCRRPVPERRHRARRCRCRELEDPAVEQAAAAFAIAASRGRRMTAVPIEPDPEGDPDLVPLGIGARRPARARLGPPGSFDGLALVAEAGGAAVASAALPPGSAPVAGDARRARARSSASPTGSPGACGTSTGCATCWPRRCASTGASRGRSSCRGGSTPSGPRAPTASSRPRRSRCRRRSHACTPCARRRRGRRRTRSRACRTAATSTSTSGLLGRRRRAEDRVGVLMIDIDRFKRLNDTFGHAVGDHVLREVAQAIAVRRPRRRRPGPVRRRGVRGPAQEPLGQGRARGGGAGPARGRRPRPAPARRPGRVGLGGRRRGRRPGRRRSTW